MAYRKIPKKIDPDVEQIKTLFLYSDEFDFDVVGLTAEHLGKSRRTIYDILDGRIKIDLDFLHAATIATAGHREIRKYLEPEGYSLDIKYDPPSDKDTKEEKIIKFIPSIADLQHALCDEDISEHQLELAFNNHMKEITQACVKRRIEKGWTS